MIETLDTLVRMATNLLWTFVILFLLVYLRDPIKSVLARFASAKKGGFSVNEKGLVINFEGIVETAVNLGAAAAVDKVTAGADLHQIARSIASAAETGEIDRLVGKRVLWVDDEPRNNEYGIKSLQAQGVEVITSTTTREALEEVKRHDFAAVITDQLRHEDGIRKDAAGYEFMRALRDNGVKTPVILSTAFPNDAEARSLGFYGATNTQHGVFELVLKAIQGA